MEAMGSMLSRLNTNGFLFLTFCEAKMYTLNQFIVFKCGSSELIIEDIMAEENILKSVERINAEKENVEDDNDDGNNWPFTPSCSES